MQKLRPWLFGAATALLLVSAPTDAQTIQNGLIEGVVRDQTGAVVANAFVSVASPSLVGGRQEARTDAFGSYRVLALPPGTYGITVAAAGFTPQTHTDVVVAPGRNLTVDVVLPVPPLHEQAMVAGEPIAADIRSTSISIALGKTMLENLPLQRDVTNLINLAPGVKGSVALGGAVLGNPMQIDDMNANDPTTGVPALHPNLYWIEEAQMVGAGADARYGDYSGMQMNLVTRSGADMRSGAGQFLLTPDRWTADNRPNVPKAMSRQILERWDTFVQTGGPIVRQRLWFFSGGEHYRDRTRPDSFLDLPRDPQEPSIDSQENNFTLKLTGAATRTLRIDGLVQHIHSDIKNFNAGPTTMAESLAEHDDRESLGNVSSAWIVDNRTLVELRGGMNKVADDRGPSLERRNGPPGHIDALTGIESVNATGFSVHHSRVASAGVSLTRFASDAFFREHKLIFGAEYEHTSARLEDGYPGGVLYYDYGGQPYLAFEYAGSSRHPKGSTTTLYAQDAWSAAPRLTVTPGVRLAFDSGSVQDRGQVLSKHTISPRIGLAWDVTGSHHTIVRAHYGHYHEVFATSFFHLLDPRGATPFVEAQVTAPGVLVPLMTFPSTDIYEISPDLRMPYVREMVGSAEYATNQRVSVTVQWIRRDWERIVAGTRPDASWTPFQFVDPGPDGVSGNGDDGGLLTAYKLTNPGGTARWVLANPSAAYHSYDSAQAIGRVRLASLEMQGSWTWSRTVADYANNFTSNVGLNSAGPFPGSTFTTPNGLVNSGGRTMFDTPLDIKLMATWSTASSTGIRVSGIYTAQSGLLTGRVVNGRVPGGGLVSVLAEPLTRRGPTSHTLDLRLDKPFGVGGGQAVHVLLDVFNVWNQGIATSVLPISGPNFGAVTSWSAPRSFRVAVRATF